MTTTDSNGIVFLEETDPISPLQTTINTLQTATSLALSTMTRSPRFAANAAARNALLASLGSSATSPLYVHQQDILATVWHDGTRWHRTADSQVGFNSYAGTTIIPATWTTFATVTATTLGGPCTVMWDAVPDNDNSGNTRVLNCRVQCDGVTIGNSPDYDVPNIVGSTHRVSVSGASRSTPGAGAHTWTIQFQASVTNTMRCRSASLSVTEHP